MKLKTKHLFQLTLLCMVLVGVFLIPQKTYAKDSDFVIENGVLKEYKGHSKNVVIPEGVTTIEAGVFGKLGNDKNNNSYFPFIESITIPSSVKKIKMVYQLDTFGGTNLKKITVSKNNKYFCSVKGVLYDKKKKTLIRYPRGLHKMVPIPKTVVTIGEGAFCSCDIKKFKIPKTIKKIDTGAFAYFSFGKGIDLTIPNSVKSIGVGAFFNSGIKNITLSNKMKEIPMYSFSYCFELENITVPKSVKKIDSWAFQRVMDNITVKGYKGSYAQSYAKKNNIKFKVIKK